MYRILYLLFGLCMLTPSAHAQFFADVPVKDSLYEATEMLRLNRIIIGYPDGNFHPENSINRVEFVKIVVSALFEEDFIKRCQKTVDETPREDTSSLDSFEEINMLELQEEEPTYAFKKFTDVDYTEWYGDYLCIAQVHNIIGGYDDNTFRPDLRVNFAEASAILARAFGVLKATHHITVDSIWYRPYVQDLSDIRAIPDTVNGFDYVISRGDMAEMIHRLILYKDNRFLTPKPYLTYEDLVRTGTWETYKNTILGLTFHYPEEWPKPYLIDRAYYDEAIPKEHALWRIYTGPKPSCPGFGECIERIYSIDGFQRDRANTIIQEVNKSRYTTAISDRVVNGSRVIIFDEQLPKCTVRSGIILGEEYVYVLSAKCGGDIASQTRMHQRLIERFEAIRDNGVKGLRSEE